MGASVCTEVVDMQYVGTATLDGVAVIVIDAAALDQERRSLLARLQWINRVLGYPPIPTGKQIRLQRGGIDKSDNSQAR